MKMKKKFKPYAKVLALLASAFLLFGAVGCSDGGDDSGKEGGNSTTQNENSGQTESTGETATISAPDATATTGVSPDADIVIAASAKPAKVTIYKGDELIDTINASDENYYTGAMNTIAAIKVKDQLILFLDGKVIVKPHTDSESYGQLGYNTTYAVKFDDEQVFEFTTRETEPTISDEDKIITVGSSSDSDFATVQGALNYLRKNSKTGDWTIKIAKGSYHERLYYKGDANVTLVGEDETEGKVGVNTIIYWKNNNAWNKDDQRKRTNFLWQGKNLTIKNLTFKSTYLRTVDGSSNNDSTEVLYFDSKSNLVAYDSSFLGHQDTLIMGNNGGRAWFYKDFIEGDVDFIWGTIDVALFEECKIHMIGDDAEKAYIFASRTVTDNEANKGFVLYNCDVSVDSSVAAKAYYGRNSAGSDTQASVINCTFSSAINKNLWASAAGEYAVDVAGDAAIGYKDYGNTVSGTTISTTDRLDNTYNLSARVVNREYNGRYVILNRGFDKTNKVYKTASTLWNISAYETEFKATTDNSKKNIFVEPVYKAKVVGGTEVSLEVTKLNSDATVTFKSSSESIATVTDEGVVSTIAEQKGTVTITATSSDGNTDIAIIDVIAEEIPATSIELTVEESAKTMVLDDVQWITASFKAADTSKEVSDQSVSWTATGGIKLIDETNKALVTTLTTTGATVGIYAESTTSGTVKANSAVYSGLTDATVTFTISDDAKKVGTIPEAGYTFYFRAKDETSKDKLLSGGDCSSADVYFNHNVGSTGSTPTLNDDGSLKSFGSTMGGKYLTQLKAPNRAGIYTNNYDLKSNKSTMNGNARKSGDTMPTEDALMLYEVQGPFKVTVVESKKSGGSRYIGIKCGEKATVIYDAYSNYDANSGAYTVKYDGTDKVSVMVASSNDVYIGYIKLENYTPSVSDVSIAFDSNSLTDGVLTLDLKDTNSATATVEATLSGNDKDSASVTYESSNTNIATVDSTGKVTAVALGEAKITAKESLKEQPAEYTVHVKNTGVSDNYKLNFTAIEGKAGDYGIFESTNGSFNKATYGWQWSGNGTLAIDVKGSSTITLANSYVGSNTTCSITFASTDTSGKFTSDGTTTVTSLSATTANGTASNPEKLSVVYTGENEATITFTFGAMINLSYVEVVSANAETVYVTAQKYDFTTDYATYTSYTLANNGFTMSGGSKHDSYGWNMKKDSTLTLVVSGNCTVSFLGSQHSSLSLQAVATALEDSGSTSISPASQTSKVTKDKEDTVNFTYTGGAATLVFTAAQIEADGTNSGSDIYLPSVAIAYSN